MTEEAAFPDPEVERLKAARDNVSVLKYKLIHLRGIQPLVLVFAFEGDDDKIIYSHWIRRLRSDLAYEPFPCKGKRKVIEFRNMLRRDAGELRKGVYYFIDRDFDEDPALDPATFVTDSYSLENHLVCPFVLDEVLKIYFHCHGSPDVREAIVGLFASVYSQFLQATEELNRRIFTGVRLGILGNSLPDNISAIAALSLDRVTAVGGAADLIVFKREPQAEEMASCNALFAQLDPRSRYRGKFAFMFFERWLGLLADEYGKDASTMWGPMDRASRVRRNELVLGSFAAKSKMPEGLKPFIDNVFQAQAA